MLCSFVYFFKTTKKTPKTLGLGWFRMTAEKCSQNSPRTLPFEAIAGATKETRGVGWTASGRCQKTDKKKEQRQGLIRQLQEEESVTVYAETALLLSWMSITSAEIGQP